MRGYYIVHVYIILHVVISGTYTLTTLLVHQYHPPPPPINWHNKRNSRSFFLSFFSIVKYKSWYKSPPGTLESLPGQNQNYNQVRNSVKTLILPDIWFLNLLTPHPIVFKNYIFSLSRKHAPLFEQTVFKQLTQEGHFVLCQVWLKLAQTAKKMKMFKIYGEDNEDRKQTNFDKKNLTWPFCLGEQTILNEILFEAHVSCMHVCTCLLVVLGLRSN